MSAYDTSTVIPIKLKSKYSFPGIAVLVFRIVVKIDINKNVCFSKFRILF